MKVLNENGNIDFLGKGLLCEKKSYSVYICRPKEGTVVCNSLERSKITVKEGQLVVSGLLGEQWPISEEKARRVYCLTDGTELPLDEKYFDWVLVNTKPSSLEYFAFFVPKSEYGHACIYDYPADSPQEAVYFDSNGKGFRAISHVNDPDSISDHGKGDFLFCYAKDGKPDFSGIWVVDGNIFALTYRIKEKDACLDCISQAISFVLKKPSSLL